MVAGVSGPCGFKQVQLGPWSLIHGRGNGALLKVGIGLFLVVGGSLFVTGGNVSCGAGRPSFRCAQCQDLSLMCADEENPSETAQKEKPTYRFDDRDSALGNVTARHVISWPIRIRIQLRLRSARTGRGGDLLEHRP